MWNGPKSLGAHLLGETKEDCDFLPLVTPHSLLWFTQI